MEVPGNNLNETWPGTSSLRRALQAWQVCYYTP
jgi:hypothetical protein